MRLLLGGSPCTHWSVAQQKKRETQPNSGLGWELFLNYVIALEKYKPDYFIYENNKSAAQPIKDEIARQLQVVVPDLLTPDNGHRLTYINSSLVSAQNRERFYVTNFGDVYQPQDRGIYLRDILDGITDRDKARTVLSSIGRTTTREYFQKNQNTMAYEPVLMQYPRGKNKGGPIYRKAPTMTASSYETNVKTVEQVAYVEKPCGQRLQDKSRTITAGYSTCSQRDLRMDIESNGFMGKQGVIEMTPYYATPIMWDEKGQPTKAVSHVDKKAYTVYEVKGGKITIRGMEYSIKLADGFYIIRKLTVNECKKLQTIPDWYKFPVSDSQAYKMIGNGWTIAVIMYLLSHIPNILSEEIEVLSMYDGMSCGQIALKEMGCNVVRYFATEIDKYAIQTTQYNFPQTIQIGDAFDVRQSWWHPWS